jgi:hypothetical protein
MRLLMEMIDLERILENVFDNWFTLWLPDNL